MAAISQDAEAARVRQTVLAMVTSVDVREFDVLRRLFAPQVLLDYRSLWGGEAQTQTPETIIQSWRRVLPGFDATWHELGDIAVSFTGERAQATCSVDARHWLGQQIWRLKGRYELSLEGGKRWRISALTLELSDEQGNRKLVEQATARAMSES